MGIGKDLHVHTLTVTIFSVLSNKGCELVTGDPNR